jgi:hypothetical protein
MGDLGWQGRRAVDDYPGQLACSLCRTELGKRMTAVRIRTDCGDRIDLCERCYRGHWLVEVHESAEPFEPRLSLRAIVAQRAALLLIRNLVTAGLEPDEPAHIQLMQQVAELILKSGER